jgi:NAD(P)-dependent dehydrogenase (short-subunit alcohol dehydrogenase family)
VNNAGFVSAGAIEEFSRADALRQFNTNFFGLISTTNAFLPHFRQRKSGTIVNIGSHGSIAPVPGGGLYCASKAAVDALSDTWTRELAEYNIRSISVQVGLPAQPYVEYLLKVKHTGIQPGAFRTDVFESTNLVYATKVIEGYALAHGVIDAISKQLGGPQAGDPARAAANIVAFVTDPTHKQLPSRFVIGDDAFAASKVFYTQQLTDIEAAKAWSTGTRYSTA